MIQSKQYNVFQDKKDNFAEKFPELAFIVAGLHFKNETLSQLDYGIMKTVLILWLNHILHF